MPERNCPDILCSYGPSAYRIDLATGTLINLCPDDAEMELARPHLERMRAFVGTEFERRASLVEKNSAYLTSCTSNGAEDKRIVQHPDFREQECSVSDEFSMPAISQRVGILGVENKVPSLANDGSESSERGGAE